MCSLLLFDAGDLEHLCEGPSTAGLCMQIQELNQGIATFYNESSTLWESVWGEHMHHGELHTGNIPVSSCFVVVTSKPYQCVICLDQVETTSQDDQAVMHAQWCWVSTQQGHLHIV